MTFTSATYLLFLSAVLILFTIIPLRFRWFVLLVASYYFYASLKVPTLVIILVAVTAISYVCGLLIHRAANPIAKKYWLWAGIVANAMLLCWMKFIPFLFENLNMFFDILAVEKIQPVKTYIAIGVSYYVFQGISYLVDIYLEILEPERHPGYFALFICFFPKLLQGPIERGGRLLPQIRALSIVTTENLRVGIQFFIWGVFKKVVIADRLAAFVDPVYNNVHGHYGLSLIIATYLFALQVYFDFSGYTDMALGVARCFNIKLTQNFNAPYLATSIAEFWRRWHISFSSWILDYIFKPLQFRFRDWSFWGTPLALVITFLASGLWHGASWNFIVWGGIHGIYLAVSVVSSKSKRKFYKAIGVEKSRILSMWQVIVTFHLVCFSWIFFRATTMADAVYIVWNAVVGIPRSVYLLVTNDDGSWSRQIFLERAPEELIGVLLAISIVVVLGFLQSRSARDYSEFSVLSWFDSFPLWMQGGVYGIFCYLIAFCGANTQSFIYQQF